MQGVRYKCTVIVIDSTHVDLAASSWIFLFFWPGICYFVLEISWKCARIFHRIGVDTLKWHFFVKKFIFSNGYISIYTIFKCCYIIFSWGRGHHLSMYTTGGGRGGHSKCVQLRTGGGDCHASCVGMHLHYFFWCFWQHFC